MNDRGDSSYWPCFIAGYMYCTVLFFTCLLCSLPSAQPYETVLVETSQGRVLGRREGPVISFLGIPFAEPPVGALRFRPTKPRAPWAPAILKALNYQADCHQSALYAVGDGSPKDEDCLYLNIWYPAKSKDLSTLPVLFWIYGGAFQQGSSSKPEYIGNKLAARGVMVVSCNYRLGALGFLVSTKDGLFGNYGLHDQKVAIQWVQDHIHNFGGDPDRVTLFGESAGAMSIGLHYFDQEKRKRRRLFHAVILQSNPLGYKYRNIVVANFIGESYKQLLDCEDIRCLQSEPVDEIVYVQDTLQAAPRSIGDFFTWGPVLTDQHYSRETRLRPGAVSNISVYQPIRAMRDLRREDIPVIMGTNSHEGTVFVFTAFPARMPKIVYQAVVVSFFRGAAPAVLRIYGAQAKRQEQAAYPDFRLLLANIIGDYLFRCPTLLAASLLHSTGSPVFLYEFSLPTKTPGFPCCDGIACHTAELPYVFDQIGIINAEYSFLNSIEEKNGTSSSFPDIFGAASSWFVGAGKNRQTDGRISKLMADYWATFATYGDPNGLRVMNGYKYRPEGAPWWPHLMGEVPSSQRTAGRNMAVNGAMNGNPLDIDPDIDLDYSTFDEGIINLNDGRRRTTMKGKQPSASGRHVHLLQFDVNSEVSIIERDCMCLFWNKIDYKF